MIRLVSMYKKIKQILNDSNVALVNRGLDKVNSLNGISSEIAKLGEINKLPYVLSKDVVEVTKEDFGGITDIKQYAFSQCKRLVSIEIPNSITKIGNYAFYSCSNISHVYLYCTTPPVVDRYDGSIIATGILHVPIGCGDIYKSSTNWSKASERIVEDLVV